MDVQARVRAVLDGDVDAFEVVLRAHNQRLFRLARGLVDDDDAAFDVLQDAYLRAFRSLDRLRDPGRLGPWLARIVRNEALMARRAGWRGARLEDEGVGEDEAMNVAHVPEPEDAAGDAQLAVVLEQAIDTLSPPFRVVFVLRAIEGLSVEEVADLLEIPAATVKTRFLRARRALQSQLERRLADVWRFDGARCDRLVQRVMERIRGASAPDGPR